MSALQLPFPSSAPAPAYLLHRLQSLRRVLTLMFFTHDHCLLEGISSIMENHLPSGASCLSQLLLFLKSVLICFTTLLDWNKTVCCLFPHSSSQEHPDTKTLPLVHDIRRQNITITKEYTSKSRREHDSLVN